MLVAGRIVDSYNITLQVLFEPVLIKLTISHIAATILHANGTALGIIQIDINLLPLCPGFRNDSGTIQMINMFRAAYSLTGSDTICIVCKCQRYTIHSCSFQPSAVFPGEGISLAIVIAQRVTYFVIGDALTSVRCKFITPIRIAITVNIGFFRVLRCGICSSQRIGILFCDIARLVILIHIGLAEDGIILPQRLALISGC